MMFQTSLQNVAPLAGAWIEIMITCQKIECIKVAPLAGAWIEIFTAYGKSNETGRSLPSRERGLKSLIILGGITPPSRSPRGSVD